jgi:type VI protein secretion system component VasK
MKQRTSNRTASSRRSTRVTILIAFAVAVAFGWLSAATAHEMSNGEMAAAIRASGNPCQRVLEMERVSDGSSVWRVKCNSGHFQVTIQGDSKAQVAPLD